VTAARLGELFGTDPLALLDVSDAEWVLRVACAKVIEADRQEQQKKAQQAQSGGSHTL
jgi:hypothetical protein